MKKRKSPYDINYISIRENISIEEAIKYVDNYKRNKSTSLDGFIHRHGEEIGRQKFEKFQKTSVVNEENLKIKYGDKKGKKKWKKVHNSRIHSSKWRMEYWIDNGYTAEQAIEKIKEFQKNNSGVSFQFLESKYGKELAIEKYKEINKKKDGTSFDYFSKKYGSLEEATIEYEKNCKLKDSGSFDYCMKKTNGNKKKAELLYNTMADTRDTTSLRYFIKKYGDTDIARSEYIKRNDLWLKTNKNPKQGSKEANKFFSNIIKLIPEKLHKSLFVGMFPYSELMMRDIEKNKCYFYDFSIRKIIIEYHGVAFHPNKNKMTLKEWGIWKCVRNNMSADEKYLYDNTKKKFAIDNGYLFLEIWSDDLVSTNIRKVVDFLTLNNIIGNTDEN